ncbi:Pheromone shutdown, TraB [Cynara cardunculus var. scolymus]|uniref:Pheromone shutdown, TraB n=1 Tax=Cynara cardunculus var. scolymus TaxID=59895 RepID=A0A118K2Q8_CYNCS|nr:Pheromone shutdown, TraB [Cynara cardunculus var. scolymus]
MELLKSLFPFPVFTPNPNNFTMIRPSRHCFQTRVSIKPPPPEFDFKSEILIGSRVIIAEMHPELLDLADEGNLVVIRKNQFGPVPAWRSEFVEPETIWLFGTNHVSQKSAIDVERVVQAVKPDNVVVELCRSRAGIMYTSTDTEVEPRLKPNPFSLSGSGFIGAVGRSINLGGQTALALRLLLATFSSKISSNINRPFGDEVRSFKPRDNINSFDFDNISKWESTRFTPCQLTNFVLVSCCKKSFGGNKCSGGTRRSAYRNNGLQLDPFFSYYLLIVQFSLDLRYLQRAWSSLKWSEKLSLVVAILRGITSSSDQSKINFKESTTNDSDFQLYEQLSFSYPSLLQPLIHERDTYIAWSLKRSKAVRNGKRVVGVIGRGHLNGVIYALISDLGDLRFRDLVGERSSTDGSWLNTIVKNLVRDTIIGVVIWALYEQIKN